MTHKYSYKAILSVWLFLTTTALLVEAQERAAYISFDLFYVVNSTVGGGGLSQGQIEALASEIKRLNKKSGRTKVILYISDGEEPRVFNEKGDIEDAVKRLYLEALPYPLSSRLEAEYLLEAIYDEKPFRITGPARIHFVVPNSYEVELQSTSSFLIDNLEALGSFFQGGVNILFYNNELSRNDEFVKRLGQKVEFGSDKVQYEFVSY